jgi:transposase
MLEVAMKTTIRTLYQKGYNKTQIAKTLGIDRKTVRKVLKESEGKEVSETTITDKKPYPSMLDEYKEFIEIQVAKELSIKRIHQDLKMQFSVECGYSTLRDYIAKIRITKPKAYMVLHSLPGEEAQVDFGYIGTLNVAGKTRKAWVFVMTLSYSRYMYAQITLDQSVRTFIQCHTNAFRYFDGVPETIKIDNLKAAIIEADFYEPTVQRTYAAFAQHYGFLPNPCRVYTPTDKGKVESNVKYIKENCFKGRNFSDIREAEAFLKKWLKETANARKHGTTGKIPSELFETLEALKLSKLPEEEFLFTKSAPATVWTDCHLSYGGNYYSAPYTYIGCEVEVIEVNNLIKVYYKGKEIALHVLAADVKGEHITDKRHYPSTKTITPEELLSRYREQMSEIGAGALEFLERYKDTSMYQCHHYRSISGILALRKKYSNETIDKACKRACHYGNISYRAVKNICESGLENLPLDRRSEDSYSTEKQSNIRDLSEYRMIARLGVISNE